MEEKADGTQTTYETGWGTTDNKKYYTKESTTGKPSVTTWYDKGGHEVLQETFEYTGGLMDTFQPTQSMHDGQLYEVSAGFSPHTVTGNSNLDGVLEHELHHLWQSRALNDLFLLNYGLQGLNALLLKGNFVDKRNYYEDFVNHYSWWPTR